MPQHLQRGLGLWPLCTIERTLAMNFSLVAWLGYLLPTRARRLAFVSGTAVSLVINGNMCKSKEAHFSFWVVVSSHLGSSGDT